MLCFTRCQGLKIIAAGAFIPAAIIFSTTISLALMDQEYGALCLGNYLLALAALEKARQASQPARAHDNKVYAAHFGDGKDRIRRRTFQKLVMQLAGDRANF